MEKILELYGKISTPQKLLIILIGSAYMLWVGYDSDISPAQAAITESKQQALALEQEIAQLQEVNKSMTAIKDELRRAEDEMATLKTILPEDPRIEELLANFSAAAKAAGVTLVSFQPKAPDSEPPPAAAPLPVPSTAPGANPSPGAAQPQAPAPAQGQPSPHSGEEPIAQKTEITVKIRGGFAETVVFFDRTLQLDRIIHLDNFTIESKRDGGNNSQRILESTTTFVAFSQKSSSFAPTPAIINSPVPPPATPDDPPSAGPVSQTTVPQDMSSFTGDLVARSQNARTE